MIPLLTNKHYDQPSVFSPANLLREARRQKAISLGQVPEICVLDPDGNTAFMRLISTIAQAWRARP